jgi:hypothetical protein
MQRKASTPDKNLFVYIPRGADKGDCLNCSTGVLYRDKTVEEAFGTKEGYRCDTCGTPFVEGYLIIKRNPWEKRIPRRYFTTARAFLD